MKATDPMREAVSSAEKGIHAKEGGPFGAAIMHKGKIIAVTHNTVLKDHDPTCHAEVNAIRAAAKALGTHILSECELYTTAEPCPMCLAAIYWARIPVVHVGVSVSCAAAYGFDDSFFYEELKKDPEDRMVKFSYGVLEADCTKVFAEWKALGGVLY